jgi:hypothetical protein
MPGFTVDPPVLEAFAATSDGRADTLSAVRESMSDIRVSSDGFGHIPFLGSQVYDAYDEHVDACEDAVTAAAGGMSAVAGGIRAVVVEYLSGEAEVGDDLAALDAALDGVRIFEAGS